MIPAGQRIIRQLASPGLLNIFCSFFEQRRQVHAEHLVLRPVGPAVRFSLLSHIKNSMSIQIEENS